MIAADSVPIAIVGLRNATRYGIAYAHRVGNVLLPSESTQQ